MIRRNSDLELHLPDASQATSTSVSDERDVEMLSDDQAQILTLPPHIAARFYRKSALRKRTSATSSRRSSISSIHSHHSIISSHGGPQSDHVAQHLRRASIIESRKARLADRAAHAEKVRLRAAVAKASPRTLMREERALAAQQSREKLLAEITAKCEEEVRRAKKKAEDMKERKAAEHARLRIEMAEKFAEAEKRRLLYQQTFRRPRTSSLPAVEEKKVVKSMVGLMSDDSAARIIQKVWRNHRTRVVISKFHNLNITLERIRAMDFDQVSALLSEDEVLDRTSKVMQLCGLRDTEGGAMGERGAVRTFLSSYLILAHPAQVLSGNGEQEQDLIAKARDLLVVFEQIITQLSLLSSSPMSLSTDLQALSDSYNIFFSAFHAWKAHDSTVLIEIMLAQFVELELIWQTVKEDRAGGVADDYQQGIRQNQILLLARLKRLAGPERAMEMVKSALRKAKKQRKQSHSSQLAIPRAASMPPDTDDASADNIASPMSETFTRTDHAVLQQLDEQRITPQDRFTRALTALPDNRVLVHELLINKEYKIDQTPYTAPRQQIMKHMCENMRKDVAAGLGTNWTVAMATVIQDRLLRSLKPGNSLHVLISEVLDPTLIENQCKAGTFSYDSFFDFMSNILPKLCAPYRDPEVNAFADDKSGDAIDRLARLMGIIDLLSLDHTNFMLHVAAPQLIQEAPGYECRAFDKDLQDESVTLETARRFWRSSRAAVIEEMRKRGQEGVTADIRPPPAKIYAQGLVELVVSNGPMAESMLPETLHLDRERLQCLHLRSYKIVATASILLSAKNLLKRDTRSQWKAEADRILALDFLDIKPDRIQSILESAHPMPASTRSQLASTIKRAIAPVMAAAATVMPSQAQSFVTVNTEPLPPPSSTPSNAVDQASVSASFSDPVARLILSRLRAHVLSRLSASSASERIRTTTTASQALAAAGMPEFVSEVGKIVESLGKVREVDWLCHGVVYERLWNENGQMEATS